MQPDLTHLLEPFSGVVSVSFMCITVATLGLLYLALRSSPHAAWTVAGSVLWLTGVALLAYQGFFLQLEAFPPRMMLAIVPVLVLVAAVGFTPLGRLLSRQASLATLTWLHTLRLPIELLLYALYSQGQIPARLTFAGGNLDILTGLTAPLVAYCVFEREWLSWRWLLGWNLIGLVLLLNVVIPATLSLPLPFQTMAFAQPNVAVLKFPLIWLPGFVVPVVLLSHLLALRKILSARRPFASIESLH